MRKNFKYSFLSLIFESLQIERVVIQVRDGDNNLEIANKKNVNMFFKSCFYSHLLTLLVTEDGQFSNANDFELD